MCSRFLIALFLIVGVFSSLSGQTSQRISAGKSNEYGLIYNLPTTVVDIYLEAEISEEIPGEFYNYARRHLGVTDAITTTSRSAQLKGVVIHKKGVADPSEQWLAQFKNGSTVYMLLSPENTPLSINTENVAEVYHATVPEPVAASPSPLEGDAALHAITEEMTRSSSTSKRAELAAQRIFELREMRSDILSGQADNMPTDGAAMQLVLDNLAEQEAALTAMFIGTKKTRTEVRKFSFTPDSMDINGYVLARISSTEGIIDADNLAGAPVTVKCTVVERGELPVNDKGEVKTFPRGGVAYRVPGKARIDIEFGGNIVYSEEFAVAQLGVVFGLDPSLFTHKREPYKVIFEPSTGAILELSPVNE